MKEQKFPSNKPLFLAFLLGGGEEFREFEEEILEDLEEEIDYDDDIWEESDDDEGIEVVITTATKTEKDILDTSQAVSALSGDEIVQLGLTSIKDLNNMVPGLYVQGAVGPAGEHNAPVITLRGVRTSNVTELGDPAVGTHVDGIYVTRGQAANALMFDVERVELSRGPQGTLFGASAQAGTVRLITKKPVYDVFDAGFQSSYFATKAFVAK